MSWVLPIVGSEFDAVRLHRAARAWPSTVVLPLALAGAMLWSTRKALRVASAVAVVASLVAGIVGSQSFLDRFGGDLFLKPATALRVRTLDRSPSSPSSSGSAHFSCHRMAVRSQH